MDMTLKLKSYWHDIAKQNAKALEEYFLSDFEFKEEKIAVLNEYWGDDGTPPQWRMDKNIGNPIK